MKAGQGMGAGRVEGSGEGYTNNNGGHAVLQQNKMYVSIFSIESYINYTINSEFSLSLGFSDLTRFYTQYTFGGIM